MDTNKLDIQKWHKNKTRYSQVQKSFRWTSISQLEIKVNLLLISIKEFELKDKPDFSYIIFCASSHHWIILIPNIFFTNKIGYLPFVKIIEKGGHLDGYKILS